MPDEAFELKSQGWCHVDVRDSDDYDESHAPESVNVPFHDSGDDFLSYIAENYSLSDKIIVSGDVNSSRCAQASVRLAARGYEVLRIYGGHEAWVTSALPTESDA